MPKPPQRGRTRYYGDFIIDSTGDFAVLNLPGFSYGKMRGLVRRSFRKLKQSNTPNLVIDLRGNTGGRMARSAYLTRMVSDHRFKIADSVSAVSFRFPYTRYVQFGWLYRWFAPIFTHRDADGRHHLRAVERKIYKPHRNAYQGQVYILTGGYSFSASLLFIAAVHTQQNVTLVGNETGGGLRGNSAVMTPYLTLPNTAVRLRLPLYRIVTNAALPHHGRGAMPDVEVPFSSANIRNRTDGKMETVRALIEAKKSPAKN